MIEVVGAKTDGWYDIKTDEVYISNSAGSNVGPGIAWLYKTNTKLFGTCENLFHE